MPKKLSTMVDISLLIDYEEDWIRIGINKIDYLCNPQRRWGRQELTGWVITCVSMQAHGVRALKDSPEQQLAKKLTPWLPNFDQVGING